MLIVNIPNEPGLVRGVFLLCFPVVIHLLVLMRDLLGVPQMVVENYLALRILSFIRRVPIDWIYTPR